MRSKALAMLLSLCMVASILPATAWATEEETVSTVAAECTGDEACAADTHEPNCPKGETAALTEEVNEPTDSSDSETTDGTGDIVTDTEVDTNEQTDNTETDADAQTDETAPDAEETETQPEEQENIEEQEDTENTEDAKAALLAELRAMIDALPDPADVTEGDEAVAAQIEAIYEFAYEHDIDLTEIEMDIQDVIEALNPVQTLEDIVIDAESVELNIGNGNIVITENGYTQGSTNATFKGAYVITGEGTDIAVNEKGAIYIDGGEHKITFQDLTITMAGNNTSQQSSAVILANGANVTLTISGENTIQASGTANTSASGWQNANASAIHVPNGTTLKIQGEDGSDEHILTATAGTTLQYSAIGGNRMGSAFGTIIIDSGHIVATGGRSGNGIGGSFGSGSGITINGGLVECITRDGSAGIGIAQTAGYAQGSVPITINGGTVISKNSAGAYRAIAANGANYTTSRTVTITGGSVSASGFTPALTTGQVSTSILVQDASGSVLENEEVTVKVGDKEWTATTNADGYLYVYLAEDSKISINGDEETVYAGKENSLGFACTCGGNGTIGWDSDGTKDFTLYQGAAAQTVVLAAQYVPANGCEKKIHQEYTKGAVAYSIDSVTVDSSSVTDDRDSYATIKGSTLTLKYVEGKTYTVTVKAEQGGNEAIATYTVDCIADYGFDIANGTVTVTEESGTLYYEQNGQKKGVPAGEKVIITGTSTTHQIIVNSGTANIILRNLTLTNSTGQYSTQNPIQINGGEATLWLEGENEVLQTSTNFDYSHTNPTSNGFAIYVGNGATLTINSEVAEDAEGVVFDPFTGLNGFEKLEFSESILSENPTPVTYKGTLHVEGRRGAIGSANFGANSTATININGGNIYGKIQANYVVHLPIFIGNATAASDGNNEVAGGTYTINITGGNIRADATSARVVGIGGARSAVNITGGCVVVNTKGDDPDNSAKNNITIGGTNAAVTIGTEKDPNAAPYVYASGNRYCGAAIGGPATNVTILSGTVEAWSGENGAAIGCGSYNRARAGQIEIKGGNIGAFNESTDNNAISIGTRAPSNSTFTAQPIKISGGNITVNSNVGGTGGSFTSTVTITGDATVTLPKNVNGNLEVSENANVTVEGRVTVGAAISGGKADIGTVSGDVTVNGSGKAEVETVGGNATTQGNGTLNATNIKGSATASETSKLHTVNVEGTSTVKDSAELTVDRVAWGEVTVNGGTAEIGRTNKGATVTGGTLLVGGNVSGDLTVADGASYGIGGSVSGNKTVNDNAKEVSVYSVEFNNEGSLLKFAFFDKGEAITAADFPNAPTRDGYAFTGWNTRYDGGGDTITVGSKIDGVVTAYAQWEITDRLTAAASTISDKEFYIANDTDAQKKSAVQKFLDENGFTDVTVTEISGTNVTLKLGDGEQLVNATFTIVTSGDPLAALYNQRLTVEVPSDASDADVRAESIELLRSLILDDNPTIKHRYGTVYGVTISSQTEKTFSVYPSYTIYTVSFDLNGGSGSFPPVQTVGQKLSSLPEPTRSGYRFDGWYTDGGTKVDTSYTFTENTTLYAHWTHRSSGSSSGSASYNISISGDSHGSVGVSDRNASEDTTVTITVTPDNGYELDELTVTDRNGDALRLTDKGNGKYTFIMPDGKVTIETSFVKIGEKAEEPTDETTDKTTPETTENPFVDVTSGDWFYNAALYAYENEWMSGTTATTFSPNVNTTRGMIVTILYRMEGEPSVSGVAPFIDVTSDQYYARAVAWAAANDIVSGYDAQTFAPNDSITREQLASILYRYAAFKGYDTTEREALNSFTDAASVSAWAADSMQWAVGESLLSGKGNGVLAPTATATRAELAQILMNFDRSVK